MNNNKRPIAVIAGCIVFLLIGLMLVGCGSRKPVQMCAIEEVEANKDSKGKIVSYELDFADGREVKISGVQYNLYKDKHEAPCRL
jgi:uncharacterized protein YcfL